MVAGLVRLSSGISKNGGWVSVGVRVGKLWGRTTLTMKRSLGLKAPWPPGFALTVTCRKSPETSWPHVASKAPFKRFTIDHLLWPAMK